MLSVTLYLVNLISVPDENNLNVLVNIVIVASDPNWEAIPQDDKNSNNNNNNNNNNITLDDGYIRDILAEHNLLVILVVYINYCFVLNIFYWQKSQQDWTGLECHVSPLQKWNTLTRTQSRTQTVADLADYKINTNQVIAFAIPICSLYINYWSHNITLSAITWALWNG